MRHENVNQTIGNTNRVFATTPQIGLRGIMNLYQDILATGSIAPSSV
jgi:hypothetical protein